MLEIIPLSWCSWVLMKATWMWILVVISCAKYDTNTDMQRPDGQTFQSNVKQELH